MPRLRESTAIYRNSYNSRGLISHNFLAGNSNAVRQEDGTLWALISRTQKSTEVCRSQDNGFSWETIIDVNTLSNDRDSTVEINGPTQSIVVMQEWNLIAVYFGGRDGASADVVQYKYANLHDDLSDASNWTTAGSNDLYTIGNKCLDSTFKTIHHKHDIYTVYIDSTASKLAVSTQNPGTMATLTQGVLDTGTAIHSLFDAIVDEEGNIEVAALLATTPRKIAYITYSDKTNSWGAWEDIEVFTDGASMARDIAIGKDGLGNILVTYGREEGTALDIKYALKVGAGAWSVNSLTPTAGFLPQADLINTTLAARTDVLPGIDGGFIFGYSMHNASAVPRAYVRTLKTVDGSTYTLGDEQPAAPVNDLTTKVIGAKFFKPTGAKLMNLEDSGQVRMAFQIGQGDTKSQNDSVPVHFDQELLKYGAYPDNIPVAYLVDNRLINQVLVNLNVLGNPSSDVDYYEQGQMGVQSARHIKAFERMGTHVEVKRYEPIKYSKMGDRSSYRLASEDTVRMIISPATYGQPTRQTNSNDFDSYIEKDVRIVKIPPDFYLERTFLLNDGNFLKRTVWTIGIDGNDYELTQVVPRLIDDQICYYEANAYVMGPSRDPFSRRILPSET